MAEAGFMSIFLGIENASAKSLRMMRKPNTLKLIRDGVEAIQRANLIVVAGIINGLPHDDAESIRENYQFIVDMGVTAVMDQLLTPYPGTPLREQLLADNLVDNHTDYRWYDGYFANVHTEHLSADELSYVRWKSRRELIGMWHPTPADWRHFTSYTALWQLGLKHLVWLNERLLELLFGLEGRYRLQMLQYLHLNRFGLGSVGTNGSIYHPVFGTPQDPYADSKVSVLRHRRQPRAVPPRPAIQPETERRQAL
jgi:anaerobic magnesium-protoporphyrin IX monomethyl ester cyclase